MKSKFIIQERQVGYQAPKFYVYKRQYLLKKSFVEGPFDSIADAKAFCQPDHTVKIRWHPL